MLYIITFSSTYHALNFEKKFLNTNLTFTLRPVPREISSSCGIAAQIKTDEDTINGIWQECIVSSLQPDGLYSMVSLNNKNFITKIMKGQV